MAKQIFLTGIVSEWMAEDLRYELTNSFEKQIDIYISSWGGSVNKGLEIANLIQGVQASGKKDIHTHNLSHADSIATAIFLAVPKENRHIVDNSTLFVHEPRFLVFDEVTQADAEKMKTEVAMQTNRLADFYVKNIEGLDKNEALSLMKGETNLNAQRMLDLNIVSEVIPNFEIAAQRGLISNQNKNEMSLFNKKQPINTLSLEGDVVMLYEGTELKVSTEVQKAGELVSLEGDHVDTEGNTIKVDANNKVTEIVPKVVEPVATGNDDIMSQVADILVSFETKIDAKLEALKKTGSTAKVPKVDNSNTPPATSGDQSTAAMGIAKRMNEIQAAKRKEQGLS